MSGGYFGYEQCSITNIIDSLEQFLEEPKDEFHQYSKTTLNEFKNGLRILKQALVYANRIDWLLEADDSEKMFHELLKQQLNEIRNTRKEIL